MSARARGGAVSSDVVAEAAAEQHLSDGGSALGAVLSGFFAAAGNHPGVLLGPISILVAGVGAGGRAFDGRLRQPGLSAKRPRGFVKGETVPNAARVAVPTALSAAAVAYGYEPHGTLAKVVRPGVEQAVRAGAGARAELLERICSVGVAATNEAAFTRPLLRVGSAVAGGQLTPADFVHRGEVDHEARARSDQGLGWLEVPWASGPGSGELAAALGEGAAICAVDVHGLFAALAYRRASDGVFVDELELLCPLAAVPTRRGVTRVAPGSGLFAPAPLAIVCDAVRGPVSVLASPAALRLATRSEASLSITRDPTTRLVDAAKAGN